MDVKDSFSLSLPFFSSLLATCYHKGKDMIKTRDFHYLFFEAYYRGNIKWRIEIELRMASPNLRLA